DGIGRAAYERLDVLLRIERRQHVVRYFARIASARAADTDAQTEKVLRPERLRDRTEPVMPGQASTTTGPQTPQLEVHFAVDDEERVGIDLEEADGRADRSARIVHERLRLEQREPPVVEAHLGEPARELAAPARAVPPGKLVGDHVTDVVPVTLVFPAGGSEARDE